MVDLEVATEEKIIDFKTSTPQTFSSAESVYKHLWNYDYLVKAGFYIAVMQMAAREVSQFRFYDLLFF